ncbi:DUF4136 domain-containing protein [Luteimonas kalidii]|uniref:DUF4136 domain-containing protein n=1 Tax=Luteimonas kalidii TaxID=3042025 RepID=A0ABT6JTV8_9GAMM|nr:DUF4136 domain-containing protein [Luteimonas kalidii]MDH5834125.1 DUF4136 domain-containing protein [Luteimonas kalidii]
MDLYRPACPPRRRAVDRLVITIALAIASVACAGTQVSAPDTPQRVTVRHEASAMPGATYAWFPMPRQLAAEHDPRIEDPQLRARLQSALERAMQDKGYRKVDDMAGADFLLAWRAGVRDVDQVRATPADPVRGTPMAGVACTGGTCSQLVMVGNAGAPAARVHHHVEVEGGLLVEAIDPATIALLWSAYSRGSVHASDAGDAGLDAIVGETLRRFPASPADR